MFQRDKEEESSNKKTVGEIREVYKEWSKKELKDLLYAMKDCSMDETTKEM